MRICSSKNFSQNVSCVGSSGMKSVVISSSCLSRSSSSEMTEEFERYNFPEEWTLLNGSGVTARVAMFLYIENSVGLIDHDVTTDLKLVVRPIR